MDLNGKLDQLGHLMALVADIRLGQDAAVARRTEPFVDALNIMLWSLTASTDIHGGDKRPVSELSALLEDARSEPSIYRIHCTLSQEIVRNLVRRGYLERPPEMDRWKHSSYKDTTEIVVALADSLVRIMCEGLGT
ncbi:MAG: hypothetical protein VX195_10110 [Pseudomonadota bacterium]|nr:hypothetical protein [Pseudomonadota bacterium]